MRIATVSLALLACAGGARAQDRPCGEGISRQTAQRLFDTVAHDPSEPQCKFEGVTTAHTQLEAIWSRDGTRLPPVTVIPRECVPGAAAHAGPFVVDVPAEIGRACPSVLPMIDAFVAQVSAETPSGRHGSLDDPLFRGARLLFVLVALVGLCAAASARSSRPRSYFWLGVGGFAAALALRAALPFTLGNWYTEVLPAAGPPPWMRFGPGVFALQSLLRDLGLWGPRTLIATQLGLGAAAVPLLIAVLRELRVGVDAAAAAAVLLVLTPFHARLSASASEHVFAAALCLALLLAWLRAARTGSVLWLCLAALLLPAVCATRVDMTVQAIAVLAWPLLRDRAERDAGAVAPPGWMIATMAGVAAASVAAAYWLVALPSQHPTSDWEGYRFALRHFVPQFWLMAVNDPPWLPLAAVLLAPLGLLAMALRRPLLLLRVAATVLVGFVALGRSFLHDELLGARYFLFAIPIALIVPGFGFALLAGLAPIRLRPAIAAAALAALALWSGIAARPAYAARYAFQDEYDFLRATLPRLPAGCVVYAVPLRADALPRDVDCCLDPRRSPLPLEFPALQFRDLPDPVEAPSGCAAYYQSVACAIAPRPPDRPGHELSRAAADYFGRRCGDAQRTGRLELIAQRDVAPRTTEGFFITPPRAALYRWSR